MFIFRGINYKINWPRRRDWERTVGIYTFRDPQGDIWPKRPGKLWGLGRDSVGGPRIGIYHSDLRSAPRDGGRGQIIFYLKIYRTRSCHYSVARHSKGWHLRARNGLKSGVPGSAQDAVATPHIGSWDSFATCNRRNAIPCASDMYKNMTHKSP